MEPYIKGSANFDGDHRGSCRISQILGDCTFQQRGKTVGGAYAPALIKSWVLSDGHGLVVGVIFRIVLPAKKVT